LRNKGLQFISKNIKYNTPKLSRSVAKPHQIHLQSHHLLTCTAHTIIAKHK